MVDSTHSASISKLPPEILFQVFLFIPHKVHLPTLRRLCQICKSWLPEAQAVLYRSVILINDGIGQFARTLEENESLVPLVKHLTLYRMERSSDWRFINKILAAIAKHQTLLSFHIHPITLIEPESPPIIQSITFLPFLVHLDIDSYLFGSLYSMKRFISSFPNLRTLEINEEFSGDFVNQWYDEPASGPYPNFPATVRNLAFHVTGPRTLEALLLWVLRHPPTLQPIERFSVIIGSGKNESFTSLNSLLRSFGTGLTSLTLDYRWPTELRPIDLRASTNLRYLSLAVQVYNEHADVMKQHLCTTLRSLSSPSLKVVQFKLKLDGLSLPHYSFIDWGLFDKDVENTDIQISVVLSDERKVVGVKEVIIDQMPLHRSQGKLRCTVSAAYY